MKRSILFKTTLTAISLTLSSIGHASDLKVEQITSHEPRYPTEVIARPGVMPVGIASINLDAGVEKLHTVNTGLRTEFGLVKSLEGRFGWDGFAVDTKAPQGTSKFTPNKTIRLGLKYNYFNVPHVSFSTTLRVPLHIFDGEILKEFTLGTPVVFYNNKMAGGILHDIFTLTMRPNITTTFDFKWWYGVQVYGNLWADISGSFGKVTLGSDKNIGTVQAKAFWQELPVNLNLTYAFNHYFDLSANAGFGDALTPRDTFNFGLTFTARAGRLFS